MVKYKQKTKTYLCINVNSVTGKICTGFEHYSSSTAHIFTYNTIYIYTHTFYFSTYILPLTNDGITFYMYMAFV